jgi:hypothetical protein
MESQCVSTPFLLLTPSIKEKDLLLIAELVAVRMTDFFSGLPNLLPFHYLKSRKKMQHTEGVQLCCPVHSGFQFTGILPRSLKAEFDHHRTLLIQYVPYPF